MAKTVQLDPITRIEGHLAIRVDVEGNQVVQAYSAGEMFRGFEVLLKGRHPLDAQHITQRICGVCPISHGTASVLAQDMAYRVRPPENGRLVRNLILGANFIQSHILHFYQLSALDFVDIAAITAYQGSDPVLAELKAWVQSELASDSLHPAAPFLPRYEGTYVQDTELNITGVKHYLEALEMRALAHKAAAIFSGKIPHAMTLVPGGVTEHVTTTQVAAYASYIKRLRGFIDTAYLPDVLAVAEALPDYFAVGKGCGNFLAYGVFHETADGTKNLLPSGVVVNGAPASFDASAITEDVKHSLFSSPSGLRPSQGATVPDPDKQEAYSWLKAPRYNGQVMEVGPLARVLVAYHAGHPTVTSIVNAVLAKANLKPKQLVSVLGRHAARAVECKIVADRCAEWVQQLVPGQPAFRDFEVPGTAEGHGLTEAPRGALGHWLKIRNKKIDSYQCVVPTTWNCSPRDDNGNPGAVEQALVGTPIADSENPIEAARVVRSFDPCIACAVH